MLNVTKDFPQQKQCPCLLKTPVCVCVWTTNPDRFISSSAHELKASNSG